MPDNRIIFHFNTGWFKDQTIPMWVVKHRGQTHYVHHFTSEIGFTTKETPDNPATKASIQLRGTLAIIPVDGETHAYITS